MNITLRVWRQANAQAKGEMATYQVQDVSKDMSFLEMLDLLNEQLTMDGVEPIAFDHDCREGICGMCGVVINGIAHGAPEGVCPNGSAMLFTSAKITHLAMLPQGQPERYTRVKSMMAAHDEEGFGGCTNIGECSAVCPKQIPLDVISQLNRDLIASLFKKDGK